MAGAPTFGVPSQAPRDRQAHGDIHIGSLLPPPQQPQQQPYSLHQYPQPYHNQHHSSLHAPPHVAQQPPGVQYVQYVHAPPLQPQPQPQLQAAPQPQFMPHVSHAFVPGALPYDAGTGSAGALPPGFLTVAPAGPQLPSGPVVGPANAALPHAQNTRPGVHVDAGAPIAMPHGQPPIALRGAAIAGTAGGTPQVAQRTRHTPRVQDRAPVRPTLALAAPPPPREARPHRPRVADLPVRPMPELPSDATVTERHVAYQQHLAQLPCPHFAAGRCRHRNCRFSHEEPAVAPTQSPGPSPDSAPAKAAAAAPPDVHRASQSPGR